MHAFLRNLWRPPLGLRAWPLTASVLVAVVLGGCSSSREGLAKTFVIGGGPNVSMSVIIAQKRGYFAGENLKVDFEPLQTSKIAFDAVAAGQIDLGVVTDANIALLGFSGLGQVRVIGSI